MNTDYELNKLQRQYAAEKTNHFVHFILTLVTGFIWLPIWLLSAWSTASTKAQYERQIKDIYEPTTATNYVGEMFSFIGRSLAHLHHAVAALFTPRKQSTLHNGISYGSSSKSIAERKAEYEAKGYAL